MFTIWPKSLSDNSECIIYDRPQNAYASHAIWVPDISKRVGILKSFQWKQFIYLFNETEGQ